MKTKRNQAARPAKARTGIEGFDDITYGGLPCGRIRMQELRGGDVQVLKAKKRGR